jgi:hypothetical protein
MREYGISLPKSMLMVKVLRPFGANCHEVNIGLFLMLTIKFLSGSHATQANIFAWR